MLDKCLRPCYTIIRKREKQKTKKKKVIKKMYEFEIYNKTTDKTDFIFGYTVNDAFRRNPKLNPAEWVVILANYID